jgi:hypothetical protein
MSAFPRKHANARREAAIASAQARDKARQEISERNANEARQREIRDLHLKAAQHQAWQRNVETAARNAVVRRTATNHSTVKCWPRWSEW